MSLYENVISQFDEAAILIDINPNILRILKRTTNEIIVHFPVMMDDGSVDIFTGYRVQHTHGALRHIGYILPAQLPDLFLTQVKDIGIFLIDIIKDFAVYMP